MTVKKFKIRVDNDGDFNNVKIPISIDYNSADQSEVVNKDFVMVETEKAVNPIIDYEKVRFIPRLKNKVLVNNLKFKLHFLGDGGYLSKSTYSDIGFFDEDIIFNRDNFKNSFLKLSFYDSNVPTNQNLVSIITIYSRITSKEINQIKDGLGVIKYNAGLPFNVDEIDVNFNLNNPSTNPEGFSEGFYLYHYKNDLMEIPEQKLYMRAEFNNARTGKKTQFITTNELLDIKSVIKKLHVTYLLERDSTGFYYRLDNIFNDINNVNVSNNDVNVDLFEIRVK